MFCVTYFQPLDQEPIGFFVGLGMKQFKHSPKRIVRRDTVFERQKLFEPTELFVTERFEVGVGLRTADDGNEGDEQDFVERIINGTGSGPRIVDFLDGFGELVGDFFDFSLSVILFDSVDNVFLFGNFVRGVWQSGVFHGSSLSEKRILAIAEP